MAGKRKADEGLKFLTEEEVESLFRVITSTRDKALFRLIYHRGLRASEPGLLQMHDWSPDTERLTVRRKKGSVTAPFRLTSIESRALRAYLRERGSAPGPMFLSRKHSAISRDRIHEMMAEYCHKAGIPAALSHPHALKHSCGTHVLEKLGDITLVQDHLGHKDIRSTMVYAKVVNPSRERASERLRDWK
jgi:site-specific recombinase XerD